MVVQLEIITPEDLSAYVDDQCDAELTRSIVEMTDQDDRCLAVISAFIKQAALLHQSLDPILDEPVPERLTALLRAHTGSTER